MTDKELEQSLRDYQWMLRTVELWRKEFAKDESFNVNVTMQYGIESTLPKGKGETSDPVAREVIRRDKRWSRIKGYEDKVKYIQDNINNVTETREKEVLHWLLEGKSYAWIARHMGLSRRHIYHIKDSIVEKMKKEKAK